MISGYLYYFDVNHILHFLRYFKSQLLCKEKWLRLADFIGMLRCRNYGPREMGCWKSLIETWYVLSFFPEYSSEGVWVFVWVLLFFCNSSLLTSTGQGILIFGPRCPAAYLAWDCSLPILLDWLDWVLTCLCQQPWTVSSAGASVLAHVMGPKPRAGPMLSTPCCHLTKSC